MTTLIKEIISELSEYHNDKTTLMKRYVIERLDKSFNEYNKELNQAVEFLSKKHEKSIIKRMKKLNDKSD